MHGRSPISPTRAALNPVLLDDPVFEVDAAAASVFYTPFAQALDRHIRLIGAGVAGFLLAAAFVGQLTGAAQPLIHLLTLLAFVIGAIPALSSVWDSIRELKIDIDVLMVLGALLAAIIGSPLEGALLLFLFALSGALESYALRRTQTAIIALRKLAPTEALVMDGDQARAVRVGAVRIGAQILVRPGDKIPLDGRIVEGTSTVDESAITGESVPRSKGSGDTVFAGTLNIDGRLVVEVTKLVGDTTLARVVKMVTRARHQRARVERLIDRIGPAYSTTVIVAAVLAAVLLKPLLGLDTWNESIRRGIALLIVGSPCALIIATPVAYLSAIAGAARAGLLIKGGVYLEQLARAKVFVFDKTGTLTTGKIKLTDVIPLDGQDAGEALRLAGAVEGSSTHPLAMAVMNELHQRNLTPYAVEGFRSQPGQALWGTVNGCSVWVGRPDLARRKLAAADHELFDAKLREVRERGQTASALMIDQHPVVLAFEDTVRQGAGDCVQRLRRLGIDRVEMLTGDHELPARVIADRVGVDAVHADLLPEDKVTLARKLREQYGGLAVAGDGVNDAPVLAAADVGIALGGIGSDAALEAADVVVMNDRIERIGWLYHHARRTASIVRQNLILAISVIVVLAGFSVAGRIPLPLAVIGHEGSTVLVALNALRLLRLGSVAPDRPQP